MVQRLHFGRVKDCIKFRKCIVCGENVAPDADGKVYACLDYGAVVPDSGPFHEKCMRLTQTMCPVVKMQTQRFTFAKVEWKTLRPKMIKKFNFAYSSNKDTPGT